MICKVRQAVEKYKMPLKDKSVVVALSGGADSMALLNVLNELKDEYGITLSACHVNHGIRGASADRDEAFVKTECEKLSIPLKVLHADVPKMAAEKGLGLEECGRKVRYDFFASFENCIIATAHTLSDRSETLLLNITRGSSSKGLCSIPPVRGNIIRPLIDCTRADIEDYCQKNGISFVTDETNFDDIYSRNRIRLNVIPQLKGINPSFENAVSRLTECAVSDEDYFSSLTETIISKAKISGGYRADVIYGEHFAVRRRVIAEILKRDADITPELIHIKSVDSILSGGKTQVLKDTVVEVRNGILKINPEVSENTEWECDFSHFEAETPVGVFSATVFNRNDLPPKQIVHNKVVDFDCIVGKCIIRNRRAGDKMRLAGSDCTKTLKKLFNEKHLENRNSLAVLADENGILWVQSLGCADRCKIKKETQKILLIREDEEND
ncbi:MAG: tRNA lysidine(34) synthetase TilS [Clostridia bacterium]|nr:tRNA lysidine(34) synthetase TilS [Clostridia bacterium]